MLHPLKELERFQPMAEGAVKTGRTERTRTALINAAQRLYSERPIETVTVDDIVGTAAVGKGSFYNHFEDRDALVRAISSRIRSALEVDIARANSNVDDPAKRLARAVCVYIRHAADEPEPARVLIRIHSGHTSLSAPLNSGLIDDISAGLSQGRFAVPTLEAGMLYVLGVAQLALVRVAQADGASIAVSLGQQMCALMLRGLGLPAPDADLIAAQASDEIVRQRL